MIQTARRSTASPFSRRELLFAALPTLALYIVLALTIGWGIPQHVHRVWAIGGLSVAMLSLAAMWKRISTPRAGSEGLSTLSQSVSKGLVVYFGGTLAGAVLAFGIERYLTWKLHSDADAAMATAQQLERWRESLEQTVPSSQTKALVFVVLTAITAMLVWRSADAERIYKRLDVVQKVLKGMFAFFGVLTSLTFLAQSQEEALVHREGEVHAMLIVREEQIETLTRLATEQVADQITATLMARPDVAAASNADDDARRQAEALTGPPPTLVPPPRRDDGPPDRPPDHRGDGPDSDDPPPTPWVVPAREPEDRYPSPEAAPDTVGFLAQHWDARMRHIDARLQRSSWAELVPPEERVGAVTEPPLHRELADWPPEALERAIHAAEHPAGSTDVRARALRSLVSATLRCALPDLADLLGGESLPIEPWAQMIHGLNEVLVSPLRELLNEAAMALLRWSREGSTGWRLPAPVLDRLRALEAVTLQPFMERARIYIAAETGQAFTRGATAILDDDERVFVTVHDAMIREVVATPATVPTLAPRWRALRRILDATPQEIHALWRARLGDARIVVHGRMDCHVTTDVHRYMTEQNIPFTFVPIDATWDARRYSHIPVIDVGGLRFVPEPDDRRRLGNLGLVPRSFVNVSSGCLTRVD